MNDQNNELVVAHEKSLTSSLVSEKMLQTLSKEEQRSIAKAVIEKKIELEFEAAKDEAMRRNASVTLQEFDKRVSSIDASIDKTDIFKGRHEEVRLDVPNGTLRSSYRSGLCFVATATYCNPHHPDVEYLRQFRDQYLQQTATGQRFIRWYYGKAGPAMANVVSKLPPLRWISLVCLKTLVAVLRVVFPTK